MKLRTTYCNLYRLRKSYHKLNEVNTTIFSDFLVPKEAFFLKGSKEEKNLRLMPFSF